MGIIWAFAPFILFVIVERLVGVQAGLICGALVAAWLLARDWMTRRKSLKVLEIGTFVLFGGLAAYAFLTGAAWSIVGVRLRVDAGLLLIVLVSLAIRRPFTLQYAREQAPSEDWSRPAFVHANYAISAVWALAFAIMVAADLVMLYVPDVPQSVGIVATVTAIYAAFQFTSWYPNRQRSKIA